MPSPTGSHTANHRAKQVAFWVGVVSLPSDRSARFGNPAWSGGRTANFAALGSWPGVLQKNAESLRNSDVLMRVAVPRRRGPAGPRDLFTFVEIAACTHSALREKSRTRAHTPKQVAFWVGALSLPSTRAARSRTSPGRVSERQTLPLFGLGRVCSRRTQKACGTAMRLCASLFQGVAAPLGCVIFFRFCRNYGFHTLCSGLSACARHRRYHYPRCALRASKTLDSRLSKRLSCYSFRPS